MQGATIEAAIVALADADLSIRRTDQTWSARTNASGSYVLLVPQAGKYLVTASKTGIGSDRAKVTVRDATRTQGNRTNARRTCILARSRRTWRPAAWHGTPANERAPSLRFAVSPASPASSVSTHGGISTNTTETTRTPC